MKKLLLIALMPSLASAMDTMSPHPEHLQWMVSANEIEWRDADEGNLTSWDLSAWAGGDLYRFTLASEGEALDSDTESHELHLGMQKSIAPFWNLDAGWRRDIEPANPTRDWGYIGITGTAPWFIETDATLYVGEHGLSELTLAAAYELLFTQRLILEPEIEVSFYGRDDLAHGIASGAHSFETGLRLRYEIRRQLAPYIGVHHEAALGRTADLIEAGGESSDETLFVIGVKAWY